MGIRNEQKEQRRQLIIYKSAELFARKGYSDTKISDIAEAVNMSTGLLFHYFESKEKLFEELVKLGLNFSLQPKQIKAPTPLDYFRISINGIFKAAHENPFVLYMFVLMGQARTGNNIPDHIRKLALSVDQIEYSAKIIKNGQKAGCIKAGYPHLLSFTFWCAVQGVMEQMSLNVDTFKGKKFPDPEWLLGILKKENQGGN